MSREDRVVVIAGTCISFFVFALIQDTYQLAPVPAFFVGVGIPAAVLSVLDRMTRRWRGYE